MNHAIRVALNGSYTEIQDRSATTTLLDWLRGDACLSGTKEGCAEGDCGACTVVIERFDQSGNVVSSAVNACLTLLGQVDGLGLRTVEGVAASGETLHPVQSALVETGGTQCGFCTPGFVMTAYALFAQADEARDLASIHDALAGNLCRCTGYRPIVNALQEVSVLPHRRAEELWPELPSALKAVARADSICFEHAGQQFFAPRSMHEALELRARHPQALLLAGGTDLGLLVSQKRQVIPEIIYVSHIPELCRIADEAGEFVFGAAVTYSDALDTITRGYPSLRTYLTRLGSRQIRNMGTLGGNIGTASPIGDALPILLALDAHITVRSAARGIRVIPANDFFTGYRTTVLQTDEVIESVSIPKPSGGAIMFADKISKRRDQDISAVCSAYRLVIDAGTVREIRLAFGGMAATPKRARLAEAALLGKHLDIEAVTAAGQALEQDFQPLSDWRGSAEYRLAVARNLLLRLYWRICKPSTAVEIDLL